MAKKLQYTKKEMANIIAQELPALTIQEAEQLAEIIQLLSFDQFENLVQAITIIEAGKRLDL